MADNTITLVPVEQKDVLFYEDTIVAVKVTAGEIYVPLKPVCEMLEVSWTGQRRRINRDAVLSTEVRSVNVTFTEPNRTRQIAMLCLPLDFISGFLFSINADRVKPEVRSKLIRYQRECYKVLAEAFTEGRLTGDPTFDALLAQDTPEAQAYKMIQGMLQLARAQLLMRTQLQDHEQRLETIEATIGDSKHRITPSQAMQISQAVKAIALELSKRSGRNEYGGVYGELYRVFEITSYKLLPANRFEEAMDWLTAWHQQITGDVPF